MKFAVSFALAVWALTAAAPAIRTATAQEPSPAAQAVLASDPQTPAELVRAVNILIQLREPAAARPLVERLAASELDGPACAALLEQFGSAAFVRLARQTDLQPEAEQVADKVLDTAANWIHDPAYLATLVEQLADDSPHVRVAVTRLNTAGGPGAAAVVAALADEAASARHDRLVTGLGRLGASAVDPIAAALAADDAALQVRLVTALGAIRETEAAEALLAPALADDSPVEVREAAAAGLERLLGRTPSASQAATALYQRAKSHYLSSPANPLGVVESRAIWHWDAEAGRLTSETLSPAETQFAIAARLAAAARRITPDSTTARRLQLAALAEQAAYAAGLGEPLEVGPGTIHDELLAEGEAAVEDMLSDALAAGRPVAAMAAVQALGNSGQSDVLRRALASPLVRAVEHPDRRLRYAALEAIVKLEPSQPFPGSSRVTDTLLYFTQSAGRPRAVVADQRAAEASRLAGLLSAMGYEPTVALSAQDFLRQATAGGDFDFALVDAALATPVSGLLVQQLRRDVRTARLPVGIVASSAQDAAAHDVARRNARCAPIVRPQDVEGLQFQVDRLLDSTGRDQTDPETRQAQCRQTIAWTAELAAAQPDLFDLSRLEAALIALVTNPEMAEDACAALARYGSRGSQRTLVDAASGHARPMELRKAAAAAFCESVSRHGTLLSPSEVARQYDRYNASESLDNETQRLLGLLLDCIEARAAADQLALENTPQADPQQGR